MRIRFNRFHPHIIMSRRCTVPLLGVYALQSLVVAGAFVAPSYSSFPYDNKAILRRHCTNASPFGRRSPARSF